jgi:hypothetical protein
MQIEIKISSEHAVKLDTLLDIIHTLNVALALMDVGIKITEIKIK